MRTSGPVSNSDICNRRECLKIIGMGLLSGNLGCTLLDKPIDQNGDATPDTNDTSAPSATDDTSIHVDSAEQQPECLTSTMQVRLSEFPELSMIGGSVYLSFPEEFAQILVICVGPKEWIGVWKICSHGNCDVEWTEDLALIECPCHHSLFDWDGTVLQGPATRSLTSFDVCLDTSEEYLLISKNT